MRILIIALAVSFQEIYCMVFFIGQSSEDQYRFLRKRYVFQ